MKALFELADMFRFRWDPATLACLADEPLRFRALARRLGRRIDDRVEDNALNRSLGRLQRRGLVTSSHVTFGRRTIRTYRITDEGRCQLACYQALVVTYQRLVPRSVACSVDGPRVDGPRVDGPRVDGPRIDGSRIDGSRIEGGAAWEGVRDR